jgi:5-methylcytosine-specific restriction endonuclease McrA
MVIIFVVVFIGVVIIVMKDRLSNPPQSNYSDDYSYTVSPITRKGWTVDEKEQVRIRQDGKCAHCNKPPPRWEYHHANGDRSNNSLENCEGLCPNCHSVETHEG